MHFNPTNRKVNRQYILRVTGGVGERGVGLCNAMRYEQKWV